jgi:hypothetical protein
MSIEARVETTVTPVAQTTETIKLTVSGILADLDNGLDRDKISVKYGLTKQEVNEVFKHPKLQGRRVKRKPAVRFVLEDDTVSTVNSQGQPKVLDYTEECEPEAYQSNDSEVDPNLAMTLDARMVDGDPKHNQYFL